MEKKTAAKRHTKSEIERRFLVKFIPDDIAIAITESKLRQARIFQGYLPDEKNTRLRIEKEESSVSFFRTWKKGKGIKRSEDERRISREYFFKKWKEVKWYLEKKRFFIPCGEFTIELNLLHGKLEKLWLIEVEFDSVEQSETFVVPDWFGPEVTDNERFTSYYLARYGWPEEETA